MKAVTRRVAVAPPMEPQLEMSFAASVTELLPRFLTAAWRRRLDRRSGNLPTWKGTRWRRPD